MRRRADSSDPVPDGHEFGREKSPITTTVAVTIPDVASMAARIVTSRKEALAPSMKQAVRREGPVLVAFDAQGQRIPDGRSDLPSSPRPFLAIPGPAKGSCQLTVKGMPGLLAGGAVAFDIRPFPGTPSGRPSCHAWKRSTRSAESRSSAVMNAGNLFRTRHRTAEFKPVAHAPGFYAQGSLTATRDGKAWLMVGQGASRAQDIEVLRHLTATVRL